MMVRRTQSGQSVKDFCLSAGISRNTYFYWQRRLRDKACTQLGAEGAALPVPGFAQVALASATEAPAGEAHTGQLHVEISGIHLSVDSGYPAEKLAILLRELRSLC